MTDPQDTIAEIDAKLAYMKAMKEHAENTTSSSDEAKRETIEFFDSKIQELEIILGEHSYQKMTDAANALTTIVDDDRAHDEWYNLMLESYHRDLEQLQTGW